MPFLAAKIGTGKHLGFVLLGWAVFFLLAAWVLPPLDSHLRPTPLVHRGVLILAILLAVPTVIVVPAYVCRSVHLGEFDESAKLDAVVGDLPRFHHDAPDT